MEIIEKEIKYTAPPIKCFVCESSDKKEYIYGMVKNTYYCVKCFDDLPHLNGAIDSLFSFLTKKYDELLEGLKDKNDRVRILEETIKKHSKVYETILDCLEKDESNVCKEIE